MSKTFQIALFQSQLLYEVSLGGDTFEVREQALINGAIEGLDFDTIVVPVESLGKANGHDLDAIMGAITMEAREITVSRKDGSLELEGSATARVY